MIGEMLYSGAILMASPEVLLLTFLGVILGLVIGALPGLGPLMGVVLLLPVALYVEPLAGLGLLIAVFVGGSCGGAISAILLRIPGTPIAAATLFDGYPMAQKGRAADALGLAICASSIGGLFGGLLLILFAPLLAAFATRFGPPELTLLGVLGLLSIAVVSREATTKGLLAGMLGMLIATIGTDELSTGYRFTFDSYQMLNGFHIVSIVVGLFAVSEMAWQLIGRDKITGEVPKPARPGLRSLKLIAGHIPNLLRSSTIGTFFGTLPGAGGDISAFTSYAVAKAVAKPEEGYGEGAEGGVVATEAANNATCGGALIPTLSLGIPGDATTAVLMGALLILGLFPGPALFADRPEVVGGIFLVYILANLFLLVLGFLLVPVFVRLLRLPKSSLIPTILVLCAIGTFALQSSVFDLWVMFGFGLLGILLRAADYPLAPVVIGTILGPIVENNFRRSMLISREGLWIFTDRPISMVLLVLCIGLVALAVFVGLRGKALKETVKEA
ncbi:tripartite tricarboxylate transporter permease [Aliiruegeria sabulilitoris]|uniref:tripartite tricarboxylate transporter permease n=1 Tax=Aliiruegeria sabulilitoris TaxID=1510458 RepID=UPI00082E8CA7|nr:tripartite tricarboxylate transporter permease [Aliiruegeria sabulilitoris]NDR56185.1 tripartite tricarboxylate transporter protein TctA [Pseudoruegeria sp. M32A2M]